MMKQITKEKLVADHWIRHWGCDIIHSTTCLEVIKFCFSLYFDMCYYAQRSNEKMYYLIADPLM